MSWLRYLLVCVSLVAGEPKEGSHGVWAGAQDKYKGGNPVHVVVQGLEADRGALYKLLTQVLAHKLAHRKDGLKYHKS